MGCPVQATIQTAFTGASYGAAAGRNRGLRGAGFGVVWRVVGVGVNLLFFGVWSVSVYVLSLVWLSLWGEEKRIRGGE
jgi:hypothetical protein